MDVPLLVEQQSVVESHEYGAGQVTIPRRRAESMLVDAYRDKLARMSDVEISKLFERDILRDFPSEAVFGVQTEAGGGMGAPEEPAAEQRTLPRKTQNTASETPETSKRPTISRTEDETASLLGLQRSEDERKMAGLVADTSTTPPNVIKRLLGDIQDPKEVALPVMVAGALVLGVALMYKLISTLSQSSDAEPSETQVRTGTGGRGTEDGSSQLPLPSEDPYLMYDQPASSGQVIWQRRDDGEETGGRAVGKATAAGGDFGRETEDPWRAPMPKIQNTEISGNSERRSVNSADFPTTAANSIPPAPKDVLDNAEGVVRRRR